MILIAAPSDLGDPTSPPISEEGAFHAVRSSLSHHHPAVSFLSGAEQHRVRLWLERGVDIFHALIV